MIGEIIAIGDELTSGRIVNTTSSFAAIQLFAAGHDIFAMHTIGDTPSLIGEALMRAIERVDFVIVTGGLGATSDDLTNEAKFSIRFNLIFRVRQTTSRFSKNSPGFRKELKC